MLRFKLESQISAVDKARRAWSQLSFGMSRRAGVGYCSRKPAASTQSRSGRGASRPVEVLKNARFTGGLAHGLRPTARIIVVCVKCRCQWAQAAGFSSKTRRWRVRLSGADLDWPLSTHRYNLPREGVAAR